MTHATLCLDTRSATHPAIRMRRILTAIAATMVLSAPLVQAQSIILDKDEERVFTEFNWIPYAFFSESFGLGFGVGGAYSGWPTEPSSVLGALTLGTKGSYNLALAMTDYQVPGVPRLTFEPTVLSGLYRDQRIYAGRRADFPGERAGANGSDEDNHTEVKQWDNWVRLGFEYLLPIGHGRDEIVHRYIVDRGFLLRNPSGGETWNPLESGRTTLAVRPQWRGQDLEDDDGQEFDGETFNVELVLEHDNRDFPFNATKGSSRRISYQRDFTDDERFGEWESWTFEYDKLFDLPTSERVRQRVLALGLWTSYVPTWETETIDGDEVVTERPPYYEGATLGGIYRMRAFEDNRWQDKAAMYYSAEYRVVPDWQPLPDVSWLDWASIQYWQWVVFAELGQVAPHYNIGDLHDDMRFDAGFGLRGMIHKAVCRLDIAFGEEGARVVAMYGQPF